MKGWKIADRKPTHPARTLRCTLDQQCSQLAHHLRTKYNHENNPAVQEVPSDYAMQRYS